MGARCHGNVDVETITARHAGGRMQHHPVANLPFGIKRLLHPQRPLVAPLDHGGPAGARGKAQAQAGVPG